MSMEIKKVQTIGTWREDKGLAISKTSMWERRSNLEGMSIKAATVSFPPMQILHYDILGESIISSGGLFLEPLNIMAEELNFTINFIIPNDGQWGSLVNYSSWTGMIGMLVNKEADIAVADLSTTEARQRVVTFGRSIAEEELTLISATTGEPYGNPLIYREIFPNSVWYLCFGMIIILSTCFYIMNYSGINLMHNHFDSEEFSITNSLGLSLTFFRQIYYNVNINCKSARLLFILSAVFTYLLYIHYTAYLTAASTYGTKSKIHSFWDIINSDYKVTVSGNGVYHDFLKYAKQGTSMYEVYHKTIKDRPGAIVPSSDDARKSLGKEKTLIYGGDFYYKSQYEGLHYFNIQG